MASEMDSRENEGINYVPFDPDTLLPSQYSDRAKKDDGLVKERALMYAVLKDGISCFHKYLGVEDPKRRQLYMDARAWIESDSVDNPFTYVTVCETLGINYENLRNRLLRWRSEELERIKRGEKRTSLKSLEETLDDDNDFESEEDEESQEY